VEISQPVSPRFEASRIAKTAKAPVLFHDVSGSKVIMNLLGSRDELASILGVPKEENNKSGFRKFLRKVKYGWCQSLQLLK